MDDTSYDFSEEEHHRVVNVYGRNGSDYQEMPFSIPKQSVFYFSEETLSRVWTIIPNS